MKIDNLKEKEIDKLEEKKIDFLNEVPEKKIKSKKRK